MKTKKNRRIALFIPKFLWALRAAIAKFSQAPHHWDTLTFPRNPEGFLNAKKWNPDAAIGMFGRDDLFSLAQDIAPIIVNIHGGKRFPDMAQIGYDHATTGKLAAEHLLSLGFSSFGAIGFPGGNPSADLRITGFLSAIEQCDQDIFDPKKTYPKHPPMNGNFIEADDEKLHRWVFSLPKPCAVFASGDMMAARVLKAALHLEIEIPENLAVVGVGNIEEFCLDLPIALSSVSIPWDKIGTEAANWVCMGFERKSIRKNFLLFQPLEVVVRPSSDILCINDKHISAALRFIRANACNSISVPDVLEHVPIARRAFERRFRAFLGRSPLEEIIRIRIEAAAQLLAKSDMSIELIAEKTGFQSSTRLTAEFKKLRKIPPGAYRKQCLSSPQNKTPKQKTKNPPSPFPSTT